MLKVFENEGKVNFVDTQNSLVGFDISNDCCSHGGWFISENIISENLDEHDMHGPKDYPDYNFDVHFFQQRTIDDEEGEIAIFKLIAENKLPLFLYIYNCHNGFYSKGFEAYLVGGIQIEGYL